MVRLIKEKRDSGEAFKYMTIKMETLTDRKVKRLRRYNASVFLSQKKTNSGITRKE